MDKNEHITFRVSEKQKAQILLRCLELGMKISDYIRFLVMKDLENKGGAVWQQIKEQ